MKRLFSTALLIFSPWLCSSLYAHSIPMCPKIKFQQNQSSWAGHYYLNGVMELGSELLLQADGTFKWYLAYGALDQFAEGTWWQNKECIGLKADPKYQDLMIFPKYLAIDENHLNVVWDDGTQQGNYIQAKRPD